MRPEETAMIEMNEQLRQAVQASPNQPIRLIDPATNEAFVLVRAAEYERMKHPIVDDSDWTDEERAALASEAGRAIGWDEMSEYDAA
jgi:hypothetical protein